MRTLFLTRGIPGCGKSTFLSTVLKDKTAYVISSDDLRMQFGGLAMDRTGNYKISQDNDTLVWKKLKEILEFRMKNRLTTIIDATHYSLKLIKNYQSLCNDYNYELIVIDFSSVPLETCIQRNQGREEHKIVPEEVLERMDETIQKENLIWPSSIKIMNFTQFENYIKYFPLNYNKFENIAIFGDLHGCLEPLQKFFEDYPFNPKTKYIFTGDYIDRGIQNKELLEFLLSIRTEPNVLFLEGNHERWLSYYAKGQINNIRSDEFLNETMKQLEGIDKKSLKGFCKRLVPFSYFCINYDSFLVTHGGLSNLPNILTNEEDIIKGVGKYKDSKEIDEIFHSNLNFETDLNNKVVEKKFKTYQVHGHRNVLQEPLKNTDGSFNLEGDVEHGGNLRILYIKSIDGKNEIEGLEYKNSIFRSKEKSLLIDFSKSKLVLEKKLGKGISSFNFTKDVFWNAEWDASSIKARGLFIHKDSGKVIARSYDKFFNYEEVEATMWDNLREKLWCPVIAWKKENGYLGLLSWDNVNEEFFIASKTTNSSDFAIHLKEMLEKRGFLNTKIEKFLKENDCTIAFEVCDNAFDPHIIKYDSDKLVVLDIFENNVDKPDLNFSKLKMGELKALDIEKWNIEFKKTYKILHNIPDVKDFLEQDSKSLNFEGWVLQDSHDFMFKLKTRFYRFWKCARSKDLDPARIPLIAKQGFEEECKFLSTINKKDYALPTYQRYNIIKLIEDFNSWAKK